MHQKPPEIRRAVWCLAIGLGAVAVYDLLHALPDLRRAATGLIAPAIFAWLIFIIDRGKSWRGRAWARLLYALVVLLPLVGILLVHPNLHYFAGQLAAILMTDIGGTIIGTGHLVLSIYAVFLMFRKPGCTWFEPTPP